MSFESSVSSWASPISNGNGTGPHAVAPDEKRPDAAPDRFIDASVVQVVRGDAHRADAMVETLHPATLEMTHTRIVATDGSFDWTWLVADLEAVVHGADDPWTILVVPGVADFGVAVRPEDADRFRRRFDRVPGLDVRYQTPPVFDDPAPFEDAPPLPPPSPPANELPIVVDVAETTTLAELVAPPPLPPPMQSPIAAEPVASDVSTGVAVVATDPTVPHVRLRDRRAARGAALMSAPASLTGIEAREISAWFGSHQVLDRVSLDMPAGRVTALIGPSGCGKSTFLRILNRMHEMVPSASLAGEVLLDGHDIYDPARKLTDARREIGMVFQKPNPFPAMSIYDNVVASLRLTGLKVSTEVKDELVESCLSKAGLWNEVKDRLRQPGGGLSGGQQQRLCIARALAIRPRVLLMDEPCSALDPTSTRRIEETIGELVSEVTIVIVTHNMQQAFRVSHQCAFFLAEQGTPGVIVEHGPTTAMFGSPQDPRTDDYVNGRFG